VFSGIVEEVGRVVEAREDGGHRRLTVACREVLADAAIGSSIAVDGCCLTVVALDDGTFTVDIMGETISRTTLGDLETGDRVNLERPLRVDGRLGGHVVQGHVDAVGEIVSVEDAPGSLLAEVAVARSFARYIVEKGSIAVGGVSLTVIDVRDEGERSFFRVGIIPHTVSATTFGTLQPGERVNLEADVLAKYVERLVQRTETEAQHA
jgi:riboflavin synthase